MTACFRIFGCGMLLLGVVACSRTPGSIPQSTTAPQAVKAIEPEPKVDTVPSSPPPPQSLPALSNRVDIVLEVTSSNKPNELQLRGWTNLPTGMRFGALVVDRHGVAAQKDWTTFEIGPNEYIQPQSLYLQPGRYVLWLRSMYAQVQPAAVQRITGLSGENLKGPLVESKAGETVVAMDFDFTVGGASGVAQQARNFAQDISVAKEVYAGFENLYQRVQSDCTLANSSQFQRDFEAALSPLRERVKNSTVGSAGGYLQWAGNALHWMPSQKPGCGVSSSSSWYADSESEYRKQMQAAFAAMKLTCSP